MIALLVSRLKAKGLGAGEIVPSRPAPPLVHAASRNDSAEIHDLNAISLFRCRKAAPARAAQQLIPMRRARCRIEVPGGGMTR